MNERDRLPEPHPEFSAHFRHAIYDTDLPDNDDLLPFGNDEGFDTVWDWADRTAELHADPRMDVILGGGLATTVGEALDGDLDSIAFVISAGFTLLRCTGSIDPAGRDGLRRVLVDLAGTDLNAAQMLTDLDTYPAERQHSAGKPAGKRRPPDRPWLVILGPPGDRVHNRWLNTIADSVMANGAWQRWWSRASKKQLVLYTSPMGPADGMLQVQVDEPNRLVVVGSSAEVATYVRTQFMDDDRPRSDDGDDEEWPPIHELVPEGADLYRKLLLGMMQEAANYLQAPNPPETLPR